MLPKSLNFFGPKEDMADVLEPKILPDLDYFRTNFREKKVMQLFEKLNDQIIGSTDFQKEMDEISDEEKRYKQYLSRVKEEYESNSNSDVDSFGNGGGGGGGGEGIPSGVPELLKMDSDLGEEEQIKKSAHFQDEEYQLQSKMAQPDARKSQQAKRAYRREENYNANDEDNSEMHMSKFGQDIYNVEEVCVESLQDFIFQFKHYRIFYVSDDEIKIIHSKNNKIFKINKGAFIDSLFSLQCMEEAINLNQNVYQLQNQDSSSGENSSGEGEGYGNQGYGDQNYQSDEEDEVAGNPNSKNVNNPELVKRVTNFMDLGTQNISIDKDNKLLLKGASKQKVKFYPGEQVKQQDPVGGMNRMIAAIGQPKMKYPPDVMKENGGGGKPPSVTDINPPSMKHQNNEPEMKKQKSDVDNFNLNAVDIAEQERLLEEIMKRQEAQNQETILDHNGRKVQSKVTFPKDKKSIYNKTRRVSIVKPLNQLSNDNTDKNVNQINKESKDIKFGKRDISSINNPNSDLQNNSYIRMNSNQRLNQKDIQMQQNQHFQFLQWNDDNASAYQSEFGDQQNQKFQIQINMDDNDLNQFSMIKKDSANNHPKQVSVSMVKSQVQVSNLMNIQKPSLKIEPSEEVKLEIKDEPAKPSFNFEALDMDDMDGLMMDDLDDLDNNNNLDQIDEVETNRRTEMDFKSKGSLNVEDPKALEIINDAESKFDFNNIPNVYMKKIKSTKPLYQADDLTVYNFDMKLENKIPSLRDFEKLMKMAQSLQFRLYAANSKLIEKDKDIELIKKQSKNISNDIFNERLHFAFLFASPLVRVLNGELQNIMQLNCMAELEDICSVISHLDYHLKFKSSVATRENFRSIITDNPVVLHFSGHGIENTAENMGDDYMFHSEKGNILLLENESAMSNYYFEEELRSLLEICKYKFEVVFVSTCHSQFAGQVFLNAGAQHVI